MSRRDDPLQSRSFTSHRLSAALVTRDPDARRDPMPRALGTGAATGVLLLAGALLVAHVRPAGGATAGSGSIASASGTASTASSAGSAGWATRGSIVIDESSGQVLVHDGSRLVPTNGIASARLVAASFGRSGGQAVVVPSAQLATLPRAPARGVPGAPQELPPASSTTAGPLVLCSMPAARGTRVLTATIGGRAATAASNATVVLDGDQGQTWMVIGGTAHQFVAAKARNSALDHLPHLSGAQALVAALPHGQAIRPLRPGGYGRAASRPAVPGAKVGDLLMTSGRLSTATRFYVQLATDIRPIAWVDYEATRATTPTHVMTPAQLARARVGARLGTAGVPLAPPAMPAGAGPASGRTGVCATFTGSVPTLQTMAAAPSAATGGGMVATAWQAPQTAVLLRQRGADQSVLVLGGRSYLVGSEADLRALGYGGLSRMTVPAGTWHALPAGLAMGVSLSISQVRPL